MSGKGSDWPTGQRVRAPGCGESALALEHCRRMAGRTRDGRRAAEKGVAHATTPSMSFTGIAVGTICVNLKPDVP
jgi:hypothetical protein